MEAPIERDKTDIQRPQSRRLFERLEKLMPAGSTRSSTYFAPHPLALVRGQGYRVWDADGNQFIDLSNNFTAFVHGHSHPAIVKAIRDQALLGTEFGGIHESQAELAERIQGRFKCVEHVRFTTTGTEALTLAERIARAVTGRTDIVRPLGGFEGYWRAVPPDGRPRGIPDEVRQLEHRIPYNDIAALDQIVQERGHRIAAFLFEPVLGGGGVLPGDPAFFKRMREAASKIGALVVIDEVMTSRLAFGGYHTVLGITPDLVILGKFIGGSLPIGVVAGRADALAIFDARQPRYIYNSSTFMGNPMAMRAGAVSMDLLTPLEIDRINRLGDRLARGLTQAMTTGGVVGCVTNVGSLVHIHLGRQTPPRDYSEVNLQHEALPMLHAAALEEGLLYARRGMLAVSTPMDESAVDEAVRRFAVAADRIAG